MDGWLVGWMDILMTVISGEHCPRFSMYLWYGLGQKDWAIILVVIQGST